MLVLSRCLGEEIVIDGGIRITVVGITGGRVRLGITAPPSVHVNRQEVHERLAWFLVDSPVRVPVPLSPSSGTSSTEPAPLALDKTPPAPRDGKAVRRRLVPVRDRTRSI
jgi:carbon storage regulator